MVSDIRKKLYFDKITSLYIKGLEEGKIIPFDDELYKELSKTYINGLPVSIHIKYLKPKSIGNCYERSLYMFYSLPSSVLVRGDNKDLELLYGKDSSGHGWIEKDGYVYDTSLLMKIEKKLYYKMYRPKNVKKHTLEEYCEITSNRRAYTNIRQTTIEDFKTNGKRRFELLTIIPIIKEITELEKDPDFINDLNKYLELIEYDEEKLYKNLDEEIEKVVKKKA